MLRALIVRLCHDIIYLYMISSFVIFVLSKIVFMETVQRSQTIIRLRADLLERAKRRAKQQHRSLNSYIEKLVEVDVEPVFPAIPPDMEISDEILGMSGILKMPSKKEIDSNPRLAHIFAYITDYRDYED